MCHQKKCFSILHLKFVNHSKHGGGEKENRSITGKKKKKEDHLQWLMMRV
mgnify:CR=1 FL=1